MSRQVGRCRSCKQTVRWATARSGRRMPLDPEPDPARGNVLLVDGDEEARFYGTVDGRAVTLGAVAAQELRGSGRDLYISHFATCPNARGHRR